MQNAGAEALFLPVVSRISGRTGLPMSRLLIPMGFCVIVGGTMIGSSLLILLNDLILTSNQVLPAEQQMGIWSLFSVTPVRICLVITGILYFVIAGRFVLPSTKGDDTNSTDTVEYFQEIYGLDCELMEVKVPADSPLVGKTLEEFEYPNSIRITAVQLATGKQRIGNGGLDRTVAVEANSVLAVIGACYALEAFAETYGLERRKDLETFSEALSLSR